MNITKNDILKSLSDLSIKAGDVLLVHSSLKSLGHVEGGAQTVIQALLDVLGENGTLVMPALSMKNFKNSFETWHINKPCDTGLIPETFRQMPDVCRSYQETHSVVAYGNCADLLTEGHKAFGPRIGRYGSFSFSHSSPWQKLYDKNAKMLFLGVELDKMTMKHLAEYMVVEEMLKIHPEANTELAHFCQQDGVKRFWPFTNAKVFLERFRQNNLTVETDCGNAHLILLESKPCIDDMVTSVIRDPENYTDIDCFHAPHQIEWIKEIGIKTDILNNPDFSTDMYFQNKGNEDFVNDLKQPLFSSCPDFYGKRDKRQEEIDAHGIYLANRFSDDPDCLLDTIYNDFEVFTEVYGICGTSYPVKLVKGETDCFEAYTICITKEETIITANDTEGIRRGIIYLEDELRRKENAFLTPGTISKKPHIRSRITRCFFSPTNRPPRYIDELDNDIDYYPDEYLNRIMHDGSNGIWIYTRFYDLLPSTIIPEYGVNSAKRLAKLNRVVEKCRRFGIGVYVFGIEPSPLTVELAALHPELTGASLDEPVTVTRTFAKRFPKLYNAFLPRNAKAMCMSTEGVRAYCKEAGKTLVTAVPHLRGFINITFGERDTTCVSVFGGDCPRCGSQSCGSLLASELDAFQSAFREANPNFEYISWSYGHRIWETDDILEYVRKAPDDVMLMQDFDDDGYEEQLGRVRYGIDYWLSYVGPSQMFEATAKQANESNKHLFAKMQICTSHEIATIPYVPAPGLVFQKYAAAHHYKVEGVVQCWYNGNYPCMMSKAAGELAFLENFNDEDAFLTDLAAITWGESRAKEVVKAWRLFENGYKQYPLNIMFSYYGPAHDSVIWKLHLKPKNLPLPRSWTVDEANGDRIGDSLMAGHTLEEAIILFTDLCDKWHKGTEIMERIAGKNPDEIDQLSVAKAGDILFSGTLNILRFYELRDRLGRREGNPKELLAEMKNIVLDEINHSEKMIPLCLSDNRLGYHSEAEDFKFTPALLTERIDYLKSLLKMEFVEVEQRIENGLSPLAYYDGEDVDETAKRYILRNIPLEKADWETIDEATDSRFRMAKDSENLYYEFYSDIKTKFILTPEYSLTHLHPVVHMHPDGSVEVNIFEEMYWSLFGERQAEFIDTYSNVSVLSENATHLIVRVPFSKLDTDGKNPMRLRITANGVSWSHPGKSFPTLGQGNVVHEQLGWIIPEDN